MGIEMIFDTQLDTRKFLTSVKTAFKIRRELVNKDGTSPIYLHIAGLGRLERVNLELHVKPKNWLERDECAKEVDRAHEDLNLVLDHIKSKIADIKIKYRLSGKSITPEILRDELSDSNHRLFFASYMRHKIKEDKTLRPTTARRYTSVANNLDAYRRDISFADITEAFILKYRNYMLGKGNKQTTVNGNIKAIKQYLKLARKKTALF